MKRKHISLLLGAILCAMCSSAGAEQATKVHRIGFLGAASASSLAKRLEAFRQGMRELGYEEGKNLVISYKHSDGKMERLPSLAAALVNENVEVILTHGEAAIRALQAATSTIPIVVGVTGDLVQTGHAASLARPGGNVTGFVDTSPDLSGKRLEFLKEIVPKASRIGVLWNMANPVKVVDFRETETAARGLRLKLQSLPVKAPEDFDAAFAAATSERLTALMVFQDALTNAYARKIVEFASRNRLPAIYGTTEFVDVGGLASYGANFNDLFRRAATYVDKILKGANPGELPIEQPRKFDGQLA